MSAKLKAEDTFGIKGRGTVISGFVIEGEFKIGMIASVPGFPRLKIHGIDFIRTEHRQSGLIRLVFGDLNASETTLLRSLALKDKMIEIEETLPQA